MKLFKQKLIKSLSQILDKKVSDKEISCPPNLELGDFSYPCFALAKEKQQSPAALAKELATQIKIDFVEKVQAVGPYLNFFIKDEEIAKEVLVKHKLLHAEPTKKKVMIEYSQPNTHKEFHVGHLRNVCLGASLVNIFRELGDEVVAANYIGDTGVHVAKCLWNLTKNHAEDTLPANKGEFLGQVYAEAVAKLDAEPELAKEVSSLQHELEEANPESQIFKLWEETKEWSLESFRRIYDLLDVRFDVWFWESEEERAGRPLIEKLLEENKIPEIKRSEGAVIADLREYGLEVLVLIKSDGNVLYGTKDLPLGKKKFDQFEVDKSVYIVDNRQSLYLKQIFKLLDLLGYQDKEKFHVAYDFVTLPEGAMASRKGNVVTFESFFDDVLHLASEETAKRHSDWDKEKILEVSSKITLAAIKFWMLKYDNNSVIVFDKTKALAFDGDTGPYLLYTIARINSILEQNTEIIDKLDIDFSLVKESSERKLIRQLSQFQEYVELSAAEYSPTRMCTYLLQLAQNFNNFYHNCPVLKSEEPVKLMRLALINKVRATLIFGLELLNIKTIKEM